MCMADVYICSAERFPSSISSMRLQFFATTKSQKCKNDSSAQSHAVAQHRHRLTPSPLFKGLKGSGKRCHKQATSGRLDCLQSFLFRLPRCGDG